MKLPQAAVKSGLRGSDLVPYKAKLISFIGVFIPFLMILVQELAEVIPELANLNAKGGGPNFRKAALTAAAFS